MATATKANADSFNLWKKFQTTGSVTCVPEHIARSWIRSRDANIKGNEIAPLPSLNSAEIEKEFKRSINFNHLLTAHNKDIEKQYSKAPLAMFITNADGHLLSIHGHDTILKAIEASSLNVGSNTSEISIGTTAPSISLVEKIPSLVIGEEHYYKGFHWASCFSVPISFADNKFAGVIDFSSLSGFGEQLKHMVPFLLYIANSIQFELFVNNKLEEQILHKACFESIFDYAESMLLITDTNGRILNLNATARTKLHMECDSRHNINIQAVLKFSSPLKKLSGKNINVFPIRSDNNISLGMKVIPIYSSSGQEKAYLLKIKEKFSIANSKTAATLKNKTHFNHLLGASKPFQELIGRAKNVADSPSSVLLEGLTGTGKELLALGIHNASKYSDGPFVAINCSAIPAELVESEFFGYKKGAFTGANNQGCIGKFEQANNGTLFLDEVHFMGLATQMKLLRVLEERRVIRVGGTMPVELNLRIIAATSANLFEEVTHGRFLDALYYRLNVVKLLVPNLKDRKEDIPYLVTGFINQMNKKLDRRVKGITPPVEQLFQDYDWPGNIRELKNCIESACVFCDSSWIKLEHLKGTSLFESKQYTKDIISDLTIEEMTEKLVKSTYERFGNASNAAQHLGVSKSTIYRYLKKNC
jgi:transcriptional regulator with PAS, ATPase and Fis domain